MLDPSLDTLTQVADEECEQFVEQLTAIVKVIFLYNNWYYWCKRQDMGTRKLWIC